MSDTAELQALVDAASSGGSINLTPNRVYVVAPPDSTPTAAQGVTIPASKTNLRWRGNSAVIVQATGVPSSFSSILVQGAGFQADNMSLRGGDQAAPVEADQHRHGIFMSAPGICVTGVDSASHTGDGFYVYTGANSAMFYGCTAFDNFRNGWTFGGACDGVSLLESASHGNGAQQVDTEAKSNGQVTNLSLKDCVLTSGADYALTLGGSGFSIVSCTVNGGIYIVNGVDGTIERCGGTMPAASDKASVTVWGACSDIHLLRSTFVNAWGKQGLWVAATAVGAPNRVTLERCDVTMLATGAQAVRVSGAISASILGGRYAGNGVRAAGTTGISCRSVNVAVPCDRFEVRDARIEDFGQYGLTMAGLGVTPNALINRAYLSNLSIGNSAGRSSLRTGIAMDNAVTTAVFGPASSFDAGVTPFAPIPSSVVQIQVP